MIVRRSQFHQTRLVTNTNIGNRRFQDATTDPCWIELA
jgi:hypothetical protein